ncbi:MAG: ion transporter [Pseudomonadota bacterium]
MSCQITPIFFPLLQEISHLFSALKVVRLLRIGRVARKFGQYVEYVAALLLIMIVFFFLLAHWLACVWYKVGLDDIGDKIYYGWIPHLQNDTLNNFNSSDTNNPSTAMAYVTALYFTMSSLTSIGFGNVSANTLREKAVSIFFMLVGGVKKCPFLPFLCIS